MSSLSGNGTLQNSKELLEAQLHTWNHTLGFIKSKCLKCVLELGVPDIIHNHGGPMTLDELVEATAVHPSKAHCLRRIMRLLVHLGFFELHNEPVGGDDEEEGAYALTDLSRLLMENSPVSMRVFILGLLDPTSCKPWDFASKWFRNNDSTAFETAYGMKVWERLAANPEFNDFFNTTMENDSNLLVPLLLDQCKSVFEGLKSLVDVGGGTGATAKAIASAFPNLECTVLDLPHVLAGLQGTNNLKFVGGDMFQKIPPANAVLLKWILHDWDDTHCLNILRKCREAIPRKEEGGKLILLEMVVTGTAGDSLLRETQLSCDIGMMMDSMGKERNEKEWAKLFADAGFSGYKIIPLLGLRSVIEVYP